MAGRIIFTLAIIVISFIKASAQEQVYKEIVTQDSLFFSAFNTCDNKYSS
jgi:hypothetical protein